MAKSDVNRYERQFTYRSTRSRGKGFRVVIALLLPLLLLTACVFYFLIPKKAAKFPDFSSMPMDTAGGNLIGNLPENLEAGGFMAGQDGLIYFANFADGGALYMCREGGGNMTKITDFPVCNINVLGTSLVFTGCEQFGENISSGGRLYAVYGINSASKPLFCVIDPDVTYYSPYLDRDGLYAVYLKSGDSVLVNKFDYTETVIPKEKGTLRKIFSSGDKIYAELTDDVNAKSEIIRVDAKTLLPLDSIIGGNLNRIGKSLVFYAGDGFVYEFIPASGEIRPVSGVPVLNDISINQFGEIMGDTGFGTVLISKEQRYRDFAQPLMSRRESKPITTQNGWYNYYNINSRYNDDRVFFKANDKYYYYDDSGWSQPWLNVILDSEPMVSLDDAAVEDTFTPPWIDFSERAEPIDPASAGDFGIERTAGDDDRKNADDDPATALDATILLLSGDENIADKYTGESVEKIRSRYGSMLDEAVTDVSSGLSAAVSSRFGISLDAEEARGIIALWLKPNHSVGDAKISSNGEEAAVKLTITDYVDIGTLYDVFQNEISMRAEEDANLRQLLVYEQAIWKKDVLIEIMSDPAGYGYTSKNNVDMQVYMTYSDCWAVENPGVLVTGLIYGVKEE